MRGDPHFGTLAARPRVAAGRPYACLRAADVGGVLALAELYVMETKVAETQLSPGERAMWEAMKTEYMQSHGLGDATPEQPPPMIRLDTPVRVRRSGKFGKADPPGGGEAAPPSAETPDA